MGTTLAINGVLNEIIGSPYADTLTGGPAAMTIIHSGGGNDRIVGGSGSNIIVGGSGNDTIIGGSARNLLIAGSGTSAIYTQGNANMVIAGSTNYDTNDQALINLLNQGPNVLYGYSMSPGVGQHGAEPGAGGQSAQLPGQRGPRHDLRQRGEQLVRDGQKRRRD